MCKTTHHLASLQREREREREENFIPPLAKRKHEIGSFPVVKVLAKLWEFRNPGNGPGFSTANHVGRERPFSWLHFLWEVRADFRKGRGRAERKTRVPKTRVLAPRVCPRQWPKRYGTSVEKTKKDPPRLLLDSSPHFLRVPRCRPTVRVRRI